MQSLTFSMQLSMIIDQLGVLAARGLRAVIRALITSVRAAVDYLSVNPSIPTLAPCLPQQHGLGGTPAGAYYMQLLHIICNYN